MRYLENVPGEKQWSVIGLGTWQFGSGEWGYGEDYASREAGAIVRRALELGITVMDTAEIYGRGRSESILGEALASVDGAREKAVVASKLFPVLPVAGQVTSHAVASAARLGVDRLDLYQVHWPHPVLRDGSTMAGMRQLRGVGLVDQVGVSNYGATRWDAAEAALGAPVLSNQVRYSLVSRGPEEAVLPRAQAGDGVLIAYSPLGQGLLSGKYDVDHRPKDRVRRRMSTAFAPENLVRAMPLIETLREVASAHDVTPSQVSLAWVISHDRVIAIPGASSVAQLESNAAAADVELASDEVAALDAASAAYRPLSGPRAALASFRQG